MDHLLGLFTIIESVNIEQIVLLKKLFVYCHLIWLIHCLLFNQFWIVFIVCLTLYFSNQASPDRLVTVSLSVIYVFCESV